MSSSGRFDAEVRRVREAVLAGAGESEAALRQAAASRAGELALGATATALPDGLVAYVDKVALYAYKVTDGDVEGLKSSGFSEDEIFELTIAAAVGAALVRLECGLRALEGGR